MPLTFFQKTQKSKIFNITGAKFAKLPSISNLDDLTIHPSWLYANLNKNNLSTLHSWLSVSQTYLIPPLACHAFDYAPESFARWWRIGRFLNLRLMGQIYRKEEQNYAWMFFQIFQKSATQFYNLCAITIHFSHESKCFTKSIVFVHASGNSNFCWIQNHRNCLCALAPFTSCFHATSCQKLHVAWWNEALLWKLFLQLFNK